MIYFPFILTLLVAIYYTYDTIKFHRKLKRDCEEMDMWIKEMIEETRVEAQQKINTAIILSQERFKQAEMQINGRINLLANENIKLREQNDLLKEKLKNLGFSELDLEP